MKIFISYSSSDAWISARIAEQINSIDGVEASRDAGEIKPGDDFVAELVRCVAECDEVLLLLSQASLQSPWVAREQGMALALKKRFMPILINIGKNEVPEFLMRIHHCDLNHLDEYLHNLRQRAEGTDSPSPPAQAEGDDPAALQWKVGQAVRIATQEGTDALRKGPSIKWVSKMSKFEGHLAKITYVDNDNSVRLDLGDPNWWWACEWLEAVP